MRRMFNIIITDLKIMLRDKMFFFWVLILPLIFIFIFGNQRESISQKASLTVLNLDKGEFGKYYVEKLKDKKITIDMKDRIPKKFIRMLTVPEDFSAHILNNESQVLELKVMGSSDQAATKKIQMRLIKAVSEIVTEMILTKNIRDFFSQKIKFNDIVILRSKFPDNTVNKVPSGKDHTIPGILIMFILMNTLIYGGSLLLYERNKGLISRMMYSPLSISELWTSKMVARVILGFIQTSILLLTGILLFNFNLGNPFAALSVTFVFIISISALSIFFGSIFNREEIVIGLSILAAQLFAALGGCWWPIEIVSGTMKNIGMFTPAYWAMDAFHGLIFFSKDFIDIVPNLVILLAFTLVFAFLSIKYFRISN